MMGSGMMEGMGFGAGYGMYFGMIFWVLVLIGIVALVVWAIQRPRGADFVTGKETALDILKKRYARGEINKEEFEERKSLVS
jgi:putative membrane protein